MLFATASAVSSARLTDKYRPATIDSFLGLDKAKRICANLNEYNVPIVPRCGHVGASGHHVA